MCDAEIEEVLHLLVKRRSLVAASADESGWSSKSYASPR